MFDEIEIIPMGKSPVHEAIELLAYIEWIEKQICIAFGVPEEYLKQTKENKNA